MMDGLGNKVGKLKTGLDAFDILERGWKLEMLL
jgi:hypothetical protein